MARIRPFAGIHYTRRPELNFSNVIAPPYDVLDEKGKARLQASSPNNIVNIDLPHLPAKTAGPDEVYVQSANTLKNWLADGTLQRDQRPATYVYSQTYEHGGRSFHRRGFIALVRLSEFGQGQVVPHEKTYKGPIEDRLKLMRATKVQLSPIFGLFSDPRNRVTNLLYSKVAKPYLTGTLEGVKNDLWTVIDAEVENQLIDLMKDTPIYIADGHHRYTTALQYKKEIEEQHGGPLPPNHPANWCMFVLVGMQDPGLLILPTHRLIGGLQGFDMTGFTAALGNDFEVIATPLRPDHVDEFAETLAGYPGHSFGLYDGKTKKLYVLRLKNEQILKPFEPNQSDAWRSLDVAILQRYLLDEVIQPKFNAGKELTKGYTADPNAIAPQVDSGAYQLALLLKPTPLHALEELGKHGEVMPQKSTYFYPKLATGMVINPLE